MAKHLYPQFTVEEIDRIIRESKPYNVGGLGGNRPPLCGELIGQTVTFRYDNGTVLIYEFKDLNTLTWRHAGCAETKEEYYEALKPDEHVVFFEHIVEGSRPQEARMVVWDTDTRLVTTFFVRIGNEFSTREVDRDIVFGYADDGGAAPAERQSLTEDLVGRSIIWTYSPSFTIQTFAVAVSATLPIASCTSALRAVLTDMLSHMLGCSRLQLISSGLAGLSATARAFQRSAAAVSTLTATIPSA